MYYILSAFILTVVHMIIVIITVIFIVLYPTDKGEHTMLYNLYKIY